MKALIEALVTALEQRCQRAWLTFLRWGTDRDIAMLKARQKETRLALYDFEARRHAIEVDLMNLEAQP